tara:strand:+ start:275 stop:1003 length:729 start_codon:yes stop_codon:yes gene_type:complete
MLKIRSSQIGKIMTNPKSKKETLSSITKEYLKDLIIEQKFGKRKTIDSKYFDKGNIVESDGISLCNEVMQTDFLYKNHESFENDYITGTPDVNTIFTLLDIKSNWDAFTYFKVFFNEKISNKTKTKIPKDDYFYQLQGYMWLTGKSKAYLCYCLLDTPEQMIEDEIRREHWKHKAIDEDPKIREYVENNHTFGNIPAELRVKTFEIDFDPEIIEQIKARIKDCREYYDELNELLTIKDIQDA